MKELGSKYREPIPEFPKFIQELEIEVEGRRFGTKVIVYLPRPEDTYKAFGGQIIHLCDPTFSVIIGTADDTRVLDSAPTHLANIFGGNSTTEMLTFYPQNQDEVRLFDRFMEKTKLFGPLHDSYSGYHFSCQTLPDGFFYEYEECCWKRRPGFLSMGIPYRDDMQFSISRAPDYRVPPDLIKRYKSQPPEIRALYFLKSLEIFSKGKIKILPLPSSPNLSNLFPVRQIPEKS